MSFSMYNEWDDKNVASWNAILSKGKTRFLIFKGSTFAAFYLIVSSIGFGISSSSDFINLGLNTFIILAITGVVIGLIMANHIWNETNKAFNKHFEST